MQNLKKILQSKKTWIPIGLFVILFGLNEKFKIIEHLHSWLNPESIQSFLDSLGGWAGPVFMGIYFVITLLFFSAAIFTVLAGVLFGKLWGSLFVIIAATAAAQVGFFIGRYLGEGATEKLKKYESMTPMIEKMEKNCHIHGFRNFFLMRCFFLPYMPLSYAAGLIKNAKPWDFFWGTFLTNCIFSPAFVYFGDSILKGPKALILPIAMIFMVLLVPTISKKITEKKFIF